VKARVQAANLLKAMLVTAPEELHRRLRGLSTKELVAVAARFRLGGDPKDVGAATRFALLNLLFALYLLYRALDAGYTNLHFGAETHRSAPEHDSSHPFQQATASDDTDEFAFTGGFYW
jgi:hypothetical protein